MQLLRQTLLQDKYCLCTMSNHLNAELNPICHLLALLGAHHILHVSWVRVNFARLYKFSY